MKLFKGDQIFIQQENILLSHSARHRMEDKI